MVIAVWVDSITYGSCDSEGLGWVGRLRKKLALHGDIINIYNLGVCGNTSEDLLRRFKIEAEVIKPDEIVFAIGINDSKYPNESDVNLVPLSNYRHNLETLISLAKEYTNKITIVGATGVNEGWRSVKGSRFLNEEIEKYNVAMREVATAHSLNFIDMFYVINTSSDLEDGLHPNTSGYQKMYEVFKAKKSFV